MARSFIIASAFALIAVPAFPQLFRSYSISPSYAIRNYEAMDQGGGTTLYACDRAFGSDSSYVEMFWTAPDQSVTDAVCYKLATPLTFFNSAVQLDDGVLIGGSSYGLLPMLFKAGNTGAVQWYAGFNNLLNAQDQVVQIVPRGNAYSVYTYQGGSYTHGIYRIEGESSGTTFTGKEMTAAAYFRVYDAVPASDPLVHMVSGTANDDAAPTHLRAMLMLTDTSGAAWMKIYDMGATSVQDLYGIRRLSDGNYLCSGYFVPSGGSTFTGVLLKVDEAGAVIWCKHYTDISTGLYFDHTIELSDGSILVAGFNAQYQGILVKVNATGDPIWTKLYGADRLSGFFTSGSNVKLRGLATLIELDANGEGCNLSANTTVTATAYTPMITDIAVSSAPFLPTTVPLTSTTRLAALGWTPDCVWSAIDEPSTIEPFTAHPVPASDIVRLGAVGQVAANEQVILRDLSGAVHFDGPYAEGIDLRQLAPGPYMVTLPAMHQHIMVMKE